jgi:hypothetical protein
MGMIRSGIGLSWLARVRILMCCFPRIRGDVQASLQDALRLTALPGAERAGLFSNAPPGRNDR